SKFKQTEVKKQFNKSKLNVMYCIFFSPQYEQIGYTIRTHNLLKNIDADKFKMFGISRYGYPLDKKKEYYDKIGLDDYLLDDIKYINLLNGNDNFNDNNIIDYIVKYVYILID